MYLLWAPAQRKRATMLYFANVYLFFFMAALFSGPGERRFAKVLQFGIFSDPARKLSALTPERGRIL